MNHYVIKMAHVESVEDDADGLRIKARLSQDGRQDINDLPYAYPLLPKTFRTVPKVGEGVLIFLSELGNNNSNRYYIGPIISQDQKLNFDSYDYGRGAALSLLQGGEIEPLTKLSKYEDTNGSFPKVTDVAVVGRKSEDIILKENEIDLRCGIRTEPENESDTNLVGNILFNKLNPAYIQLKYKKNIGYSKNQEADSVINLVADKVNILSHKDINSFNLTDKNELIKTSEMDDIMTKLHQLPYGDVLVKMLNIIRYAITNHVHPYPGMPPCSDTDIMDLLSQDFNDILSNNVRIS
jgi:hypothetical protein